MGNCKYGGIPVERAMPPSLSSRGAKQRGNLAVQCWITGYSRRNRNCLPEIATAPSGPRNDKSGSYCGRRGQPKICDCQRRSLSAATFSLARLACTRDAATIKSGNFLLSIFNYPFPACRSPTMASAFPGPRHLSRVNAQKSKNIFYEARMRAISSRKSCSEHR